MVGGSSKKGQANGERWLAEHPGESAKVLDALERIVVEYLSLQVIATDDY
jgi:uroporphyrinogen-III decarboxylase